MHTLLVSQLATPFYREGTRAVRTLSRAHRPSHSGSEGSCSCGWMPRLRSCGVCSMLSQVKKGFIEDSCRNPGCKVGWVWEARNKFRLNKSTSKELPWRWIHGINSTWGDYKLKSEDGRVPQAPPDSQSRCFTAIWPPRHGHSTYKHITTHPGTSPGPPMLLPFLISTLGI